MESGPETARELLGQFVDLSVVVRRTGVSLLNPPFFECLFCKDFGPTPDKVRHRITCIVARAKKLLET